MKPGEECGYCETLLFEHCVELRHGPAFCELRERYYADPTVGTDDVYANLEKIATPQQHLEAVRAVNLRRLEGRAPAPGGPVPTPAGEAAAQRWLAGYQGRS